VRRRGRRGTSLDQLAREVRRRSGPGAPSFAIRAGAERIVAGDGAPAVEIVVRRPAGMDALRSLSELRIAEAYIAADLDIEGDLLRAMDLRGPLHDHRPATRVWALAAPRLLGRRRMNPVWIAKHYDSGNIQLAALDRDYAVYTPGIYDRDDDGLEAGARRKLQTAFDALGLRPGATLLDVGCGWGGFLRFSAARGVRATGISLSAHQLEVARARLRSDGLRAEALYQDFFTFRPSRRFDAISLMGVLEDLSQYRRVVRRLVRWLAPGGRIWCDFASVDHRFGMAPFITRHVWPGSFRMVYLPQLTSAIAASNLDVAELRNDRRNYHLWARAGHERWVARRAEVVAASDEATWRLMRILFAGTAHVMGPTSTIATAYRMVLAPRARTTALRARPAARARGGASRALAGRP